MAIPKCRDVRAIAANRRMLKIPNGVQSEECRRANLKPGDIVIGGWRIIVVGVALIIAAAAIPEQAAGQANPPSVEGQSESQTRLEQLATQFATVDAKPHFTLSACDRLVLSAVVHQAPPNCNENPPIVHADLLSWLLTSFDAQTIIRGNQVVVNKMTVEGTLELEDAVISSALLIDNSKLKGAMPVSLLELSGRQIVI